MLISVVTSLISTFCWKYASGNEKRETIQPVTDFCEFFYSRVPRPLSKQVSRIQEPLISVPTPDSVRASASSFITSTRRPMSRGINALLSGSQKYLLTVCFVSRVVSLVSKYLILIKSAIQTRLVLFIWSAHLCPYDWESRSDFNLVSVADLNTYESLLGNPSQQLHNDLQFFGRWMTLPTSNEGAVLLEHFAWDGKSWFKESHFNQLTPSNNQLIQLKR